MLSARVRRIGRNFIVFIRQKRVITISSIGSGVPEGGGGMCLKSPARPQSGGWGSQKAKFNYCCSPSNNKRDNKWDCAPWTPKCLGTLLSIGPIINGNGDYTNER